MTKDLVRELIKAGAHFGHGASRWNPKMAPYIFAKRGNIHIIDIKQTLKGLLIAKKLLSKIISSGKDVVFVGTKRQAKKAVQASSIECKMHYVSERWLGGTLTNFRTIRSRLQRLEELEAMQENGNLDTESKKQATRLKREMDKIQTNLGGIREMSRLPGVVIAVDTDNECHALREAKKLGIASIGIIDTNSNPDMVDVAIPANDDSTHSIELILNELKEAVATGKASVGAEEKPSRPRGRSSRAVLARADEKSEKSEGTEQSAEPVSTAPSDEAENSEKPGNPEK